MQNLTLQAGFPKTGHKVADLLVTRFTETHSVMFLVPAFRPLKGEHI